jgi:L-threonylcarbamoyladenylate synthase
LLINLDTAIELLSSGEVVALPTETVYGLAGMISHESALMKIFKTKHRPFFDPLIVHVKNLEQAQSLAQWDPVSELLAQKFWPGPLTIVLRKKEGAVSDLITHGGDTVAIRCPNHPVFLQALRGLASPLAAPSANLFGQTSPTQAVHVEDEFNGQVATVDGGTCQMGIESTVVEYDQARRTLFVLRPGLLDANTLKHSLTSISPPVNVELRQQENAPGFLKNHYQPKIPLILVKGNSMPVNQQEILDQLTDFAHMPVREWILPDDPQMVARQLYADLRTFNQNRQAIYLVIPPHWPKEDLWSGIMDRLNKACHAWLDINDGEWTLHRK